MILKLFIIVYVVLFIILKIFYTWKQTLKITSIPLLIVLVTAAIFAACGISLEFFSITGMILSFGLGLDYVIYMIENERREEDSEYANLESYAIILSFFTTAVSFGALALSSFVPVHLMGLSIFIGLSTGFVSTTFYTRAEF
jgi:predicted exporter